MWCVALLCIILRSIYATSGILLCAFSAASCAIRCGVAMCAVIICVASLCAVIICIAIRCATPPPYFRYRKTPDD